MHSVILIDDDCMLCNRLARSIAGSDKQDKFRIAGLNSQAGISLLNKHGLTGTDPDSIILIEGGKVYEASRAISRIANDLKKYKWLAFLLRLLPVSFADKVYYFVARRRYRFFGHARHCSLNDKKIRDLKF